MKYSDLIQFDPIETVVQLNEAERDDQALRLVQTFVISDRMGEQLESLIFQQLQFQEPADNKGLLVVGNYGTGKSHQLAVISAVAEKAELAVQLTNPDVVKAAEKIAGQFVVIRAEINSLMSLGQFVLETLQEALVVCRLQELKLLKDHALQLLAHAIRDHKGLHQPQGLVVAFSFVELNNRFNLVKLNQV